MCELFSGNDEYHGTHGVPEIDAEGVKWGIRSSARTLAGGPSVELWEAHVAGRKPLGVAPIKSDEVGSCSWGSIDVDDYDVEVSEVVSKIDKAKLPLVPCRSKSGGLHLFLFVRGTIPATSMRSVLTDIAASLGFSGSEIFPKQTKILLDRGEKPSWIVMPYYGDNYGGKLRDQYGIKKNGAEMTIEEFLDVAEKTRVPVDKLDTIRAKKPKKERPPFSDGPPCLTHLAASGIQQGGQNNALFHMGVYFKRAFPDNWQEKLEEANQLYCRPTHPSEGVAGVIRSLSKKDYEYKCKDEPMCSHCDPIKCRSKKYGVGAAGTYPIITGLTKLNTEPAIWFVDVEGVKLAMSTEELQQYQKFHRLCMEHTHKTFAMLTQPVWFSMLNDAMQGMSIEDAPADIGVGGQFKELLEQFLTNRQKGQDEEDLLSGRPWESEEDKRHYFPLSSLGKFLEREGMKNMKRGDVTQRIKKMDGRHHFRIIKGKGRNLWSVPSDIFDQVDESGTPEIKGDKI